MSPLLCTLRTPPIPTPEASVERVKVSSGEGIVNTVCLQRESLRATKSLVMSSVHTSWYGAFSLVASVRGWAMEENPEINLW